MTAGPARRQTGEAVEWRAEPPEGAWERVEAEAPGHRRPMLLLTGALAIAVGVVAALVPAVASVATAVFIGWILVFAGSVLLVEAFAVEGTGRKLLRALVALITVAAGVYLVAAPLEGTFTLTVMLVLWFVGVGIARVATGFAELGTPEAGYTIAAGVASLVLGVLIARRLPSAADWAIGLLVGINFLVYGVLCLGRAFKL